MPNVAAEKFVRVISAHLIDAYLYGQSWNGPIDHETTEYLQNRLASRVHVAAQNLSKIAAQMCGEIEQDAAPPLPPSKQKTMLTIINGGVASRPDDDSTDVLVGSVRGCDDLTGLRDCWDVYATREGLVIDGVQFDFEVALRLTGLLLDGLRQSQWMRNHPTIRQAQREAEAAHD